MSHAKFDLILHRVLGFETVDCENLRFTQKSAKIFNKVHMISNPGNPAQNLIKAGMANI